MLTYENELILPFAGTGDFLFTHPLFYFKQAHSLSCLGEKTTNENSLIDFFLHKKIKYFLYIFHKKKLETN